MPNDLGHVCCRYRLAEKTAPPVHVEARQRWYLFDMPRRGGSEGGGWKGPRGSVRLSSSTCTPCDTPCEIEIVHCT